MESMEELEAKFEFLNTPATDIFHSLAVGFVFDFIWLWKSCAAVERRNSCPYRKLFPSSETAGDGMHPPISSISSSALAGF